MLRILFLVIALGSLVGCSREEGRGGFVYELSKGDESFFLGGTIHVLTKEYRRVDPAYAAVMGKVERLVCEVDGKPGDVDVLALMMGDGIPAAELMGDAKNKELRKSLSDAGFEPTIGDRTPPHMVAVTVTFEIYRRLGARSEYGVDRMLRETAERRGVEIVPLETAEFQARLFGDLPKETKMKMLSLAIEELGDAQQQGGDFLEAWRSGDQDAFIGGLFERTEEIPGLMERLHTGRNQDWENKIEALVADRKPTFVAVGGAHLFGEHGLLRLFEGRGWKVRRIDRNGLPEASDGA